MAMNIFQQIFNELRALNQKVNTLMNSTPADVKADLADLKVTMETLITDYKGVRDAEATAAATQAAADAVMNDELRTEIASLKAELVAAIGATPAAPAA